MNKLDRYLLDASAILEVLSNTERGKRIVNLVRTEELCTSVICYCEVLNKANLGKQQIAKEFLEQLMTFEVTLQDAETAVQLQHDCRKAGKHVPTIDCLIAATAVNNDATIVTSDKDFERLDGVRKQLF